uniref:Uncharacterized protein n=1 Tax=Cannabis sativa TaxID=3483 RepID=A0A803NK70_CANSA
MSEVLRDLHKHGVLGFDQEILNLHKAYSMSTFATTEAKSSKKGPKKLATLEEVMESPIIYKKLCAILMLWSIPPSSEDKEMPNHNYNGFRAWTKPMEDLLDALAQSHSPETEALKHPRVSRKSIASELEPSKKLKRDDTPDPCAYSGIPFEVDEYLAPPGIILTPAHPDEERIQLCIAKHNYAVEQLSKGDAEAETLKKVVEGGSKWAFLTFNPAPHQEVCNLCFFQPCLPDPGHECCPDFEFGGMDGVMRKLWESEALHDEALAEKALMERDHQAALKANDDIAAS